MNQEKIKELQLAVKAMLADMTWAMQDESVGVRTQVVQIKGLVLDAIATLYDSFESLNKSTSEQMKLVSALVSGSQTTGVSELDTSTLSHEVESSGLILKQLVDQLMLSSKNELGALSKIEKANAEMKIVRLEQKASNDFLDKLELLTLADSVDHAAIKTLLAEARVHQAGVEEHLSNGMEEMKKAQAFVATVAKEDLSDVILSRNRVESLLKIFYDMDTTISASRSEVERVGSDIRKHLGSIVRALQFEDIVTQSLNHTELHLNRIDSFVTQVSNGMNALELAGITDIETYAIRLQQVQSEVMLARESLHLEDKNPITQESMDEGDVDLF
ncbi:MAG: hypothetical protein Q9M31_10025 [Mariprofundus sp.]|nr:hypothetical protein [Mariprofundus sp.]